MTQEQNILQELRTIEDEIYWQAVETKDARFDGIFFYGVASTGIYCRPSCPSRRPRREKVGFYASAEAAETGGFRPCLRCRPREEATRNPHVEMVLRVCRSIEAQADAAPSLEALGAELGVSPYHIQRTFKNVTGITPRQYAAAHRLRLFKSSIKDGGELTAAMYDAGYGSSSRLYEHAPAQLGMTPATYRRGGKGMSINYTIVECGLGLLLVAATARGMCAVNFGETRESLEAALAAEYPSAELRRDGADLKECVVALLRHLDGSEPHLQLPLDVQATAFQLRVWEELRRIPYGATRSYKEVAAAIGQPTATRAVARACATNPVALVNPCHRVVREGGDPGGYRWGIERKQKLLEQEQQAVVQTVQVD
ncbi:MAG TPA: bifunctional DNA-binding transcriptional regulator/O6-methylguanine-DNA methyltransferase Ada [Pyrinomonadaceae bacterium]|jgi:AraC family transcriptional regulator of adaptative response/methylated-DNA-[protein]-cysteine methyltransferase